MRPTIRPMKSPSVAPTDSENDDPIAAKKRHFGAHKPTRDCADGCRDKRRQTTGFHADAPLPMF
jgi:hypothetical protein